EGSARFANGSVPWRREGSGPPLVFLHGFPLSGHTWDKVVSRLHDRFACYTPDMIGFGGSASASEEDFSSPGQARAIQGLLAQLGVGPYGLVGNDTGRWVPPELALIYPAPLP